MLGANECVRILTPQGRQVIKSDADSNIIGEGCAGGDAVKMKMRAITMVS